MRFYKYTVLFVPEPGEPETYNVTVPALPEIATFGTSFEDARFMAQDVLELVIHSRLEDGRAIPQDQKPKKVPKKARIEEIVVAISHEVRATPAEYVKAAFS